MDVDTPATAGPFVMDILSLTNEARNSYGLRREEYGRYRHHCTLRLHRIRKTLNFTHGKDKSFVKRPITPETITDERFLHLLLFQAERAWGYAMEIQALSKALDDPRKLSHYVARLKKAAQSAAALEAICAPKHGKVDLRTTLDAQAYAATMAGYVLMEGQKWTEALEKFSQARSIYDKLSHAGTPHQEALCNAAMDEIDPNIRFCGYRLRSSTGKAVNVEELVKMSAANKGSASDVLMKQIDTLISQSRQEKAAGLESIIWRSKTLPLKNAKLAEAILAAQESAAELAAASSASTETKLDLYDKVLQAFAEAEKVARKAIKEDAVAASKVQSSKSIQNTADLSLVATYISYSNLAHAVDRNLLLAQGIHDKLEGSNSNEADVQYQNLVKAYDNVVQNLSEIQALPGIVQDMEWSAEVDSKVFYFKAWRCFFTASAYSKLSRHVEAVALFDRAQSYATQAKSGLMRLNLRDEDQESIVVKESDLRDLESKIRGRKCQVHAAWYLDAGHQEQGKSLDEQLSSMSLDEKSLDEVALIKRLDTYPSALTSKSHPTVPHLVDLPPLLEAIPAKPLFFDIAFNHIEQNMDALATRSGRPRTAAETGGSGSGWFGTIWGRR